MTNLNEMKTKELKEMAKKLGVKNWWLLKKSELINEIAFAIADKEDEGEEVDVDEIAEEAVEAAETEETVEEVTAYEIDNPDSDEVTANEVDEEIKEEDEEETEHKEVKRPSLRINEIEFEGKKQSLRAWAEELEMPWPTLYDRINRNGWTIEEALTIPLGGRRQKRA